MSESNTGRDPSGQALVSDQAAARLDPSAFDPSREATMFLDATGVMIRLGDIVRAKLTINQHVHGDWADYRIRKAPGGYLLSYHRSEKGAVLPEGYTGGFMADCLPDEDEQDIKSLVFATVPIPVSGWRIIRDSDGSGEAGETRSGSTEGNSAGPEGIAQPSDNPGHSA